MRGRPLLALVATLGLQLVANAAEPPPQLSGLIDFSLPRYPAGLRGVMTGAGQAVLVFTVDSNGKVSDSIALEATRAEFAEASVAAIKEWRFAPGAVGNSLPRREVVEFVFRRNGVVTTMQHAEAAREGFNSTTAYAEIRTVKMSDLDVPPKRLVAPMPAVSTDQLSQQGRTPLIVNFVIDTTGRVRVPVVTAADPTLAVAVLDAVKQWRYAPSTQNGAAVSVEVMRSLVLPGAAAAGQ